MTWQDVLAANRLRMRPTPRDRVAWAVLSSLGLVEIALILWQPAREDMPMLALGLFLCLAYPCWRAALRFWLLPHFARRYYQQAAVLHETITVSWNAEGLATRSPMVKTCLPWHAYIGRSEDDATVLFFQTDALFQFIPKRVLDKEQLHRLRAAAGSLPPWRRGTTRSGTPGSGKDQV